MIKPEWDDIDYKPWDGMFCVWRGDWKSGKGGYIDVTGNIVIEPQYRGGSRFVNGIGIVTDPKTKNMGGLDKTGKVVIEFKWDLLIIHEEEKVIVVGTERE